MNWLRKTSRDQQSCNKKYFYNTISVTVRTDLNSNFIIDTKAYPKDIMSLQGKGQHRGRVQRRTQEERPVRAHERLFNGVLRHMQRYFSHICDGKDIQANLYLRSGSQRHRHFAGFFNVPVSPA